MRCARNFINQQGPRRPRSHHPKCGHAPCQRERESSGGSPGRSRTFHPKGTQVTFAPNLWPELVTQPHPNSPGWGSAILRVWKESWKYLRSTLGTARSTSGDSPRDTPKRVSEVSQLRGSILNRIRIHRSVS